MSKGKATSKPKKSQKLIEAFLFEIGRMVAKSTEGVERDFERMRELRHAFDLIIIEVSGEAYRQGVADGKRNRDKKIEVIDHSDWS